ncbi:transporter [Flexibacter flexilis]|nr:transporter [Flexibacter flexilis]
MKRITLNTLMVGILVLGSHVGWAQTDTTINISKRAWQLYFENSSQPNHSPADDHRAYHQMVIATDRPDQTETPFLVPQGRLQMEMGAWYEKGHELDTDLGYEVKYLHNTYNTTLWKYGISEHIEARLITEYLGEKIWKKSNDSLISDIKGLNGVSVGTKIFVCEENGFIPKTSFIGHVGLPYLGSKKFRPAFLASRFRFTMQHTLSDIFTFSYNLGLEYGGKQENTAYIYTTTVGANLFTNCSAFVELYGFVSEKSNQQDQFAGNFLHDHRFDGGISYVLQSNLQADISAGFGISKASPDYFLSCGLSYRLPK